VLGVGFWVMVFMFCVFTRSQKNLFVQEIRFRHISFRFIDFVLGF
jgi:hypothetical protein